MCKHRENGETVRASEICSRKTFIEDDIANVVLRDLDLILLRSNFKIGYFDKA